MKARRVLIVLTAAIIFSIFGAPTPLVAQSAASCIYFSSAAHNVHGAFMQFYIAYKGWKNFGEPLTEAFYKGGLLVQYFRKARLEYRPEFPEPYRVQVSLLGYEYEEFDPRVPPEAHPDFIYFPATGLHVSFAIKKYYETHFGWTTLGYPLTLLRKEGMSFAQYFQRGKVTWNGSDLTAVSVESSPLSQQILDKHLKDFSNWRQPAPNDRCQDAGQAQKSVSAPPTTPTLPPPTPEVTAMQVEVYVRIKQVQIGGAQFVQVNVHDQNQQPVKGVGLVVTLNSVTQVRSFPVLPTDASGASNFSFDTGKPPPNSTFIIEVSAQLGRLTKPGIKTFTTGN